MDITEVKVFPVDEEKLKAFVSVVFDHCFMVNDIKIIQGRQGFFISMPSRRKKNGEFKDVAHPLNNETRQRIEALVLSEYDRVLERNEATRARPVRQEAARPDGPPTSGEHRVQRVHHLNGDRRHPMPSPSARPEPTPIAAAAAPRLDAEVSAETEEEAAGTTLEEVQEHHLRDSFWTVP